MTELQLKPTETFTVQESTWQSLQFYPGFDRTVLNASFDAPDPSQGGERHLTHKLDIVKFPRSGHFGGTAEIHLKDDKTQYHHVCALGDITLAELTDGTLDVTCMWYEADYLMKVNMKWRRLT